MTGPLTEKEERAVREAWARFEVEPDESKLSFSASVNAATRRVADRSMVLGSVPRLLATLDAERAKAKRLWEALLTMTPEVGFPECTKECRAQRFAPDEQPECCCGFEEIRFYAQNARAVLEELKP